MVADFRTKGLPASRAELACARVVQTPLCHPRRRDGIRENHPEHLLRVVFVSRASYVRALPVCVAAEYAQCLAAGVCSVGP